MASSHQTGSGLYTAWHGGAVEQGQSGKETNIYFNA